MARAELTQQDLAQIIASSQSAVSERLRGKKEFTLDELLAIAGAMGISLRELLGENIVNAKLPAPSYIEANGQGKKKVAPIGFIYKGATYEIVPEQKVPWLVGSVGLEPTTKGLSDPACPGHNSHHSHTPGLLFCPATLNTSHHISYTRSPPCFCFGNRTRPRSPLGNSPLEKPNPPRLLANAGSSTSHAPTHPRQP